MCSVEVVVVEDVDEIVKLVIAFVENVAAKDIFVCLVKIQLINMLL